MPNILIFGATSAIAEATAREWAKTDARFFLVGRDPDKLKAVVDDLTVRGAKLTQQVADLADLSQHDALVAAAWQDLNPVDVVLIAQGTLPDQRACEASVEATLEAMQINALSAMSLLTLCANRLQAQGSGTLAVIGSVAGDRGRQSNYVYGAAKGMLERFCQGLRNRLYPHHVHVLLVKPGFVDTPMTRGFAKNALWAKPETVGRGIVRAVSKGKNTVYLPGFWRLIMGVIRLIPEPLFKRLKL